MKSTKRIMRLAYNMVKLKDRFLHKIRIGPARRTREK
jgi:hypothetical protein